MITPKMTPPISTPVNKRTNKMVNQLVYSGNMHALQHPENLSQSNEICSNIHDVTLPTEAKMTFFE